VARRCALIALVILPLALPAAASATTLPAGFQETTAFSGLDQPMVVEFAADGRVFVGEKSGRVKVFDNLSDTTPTVFADLRTKVHDYWDRGLEGMVLHPNFPAQPYVYVYYVHDAAIGGTAPRWGDTCPDPPGGTGDGCVVSGRVSRLTANGNAMTGSEQVLVEDWCMQYPSHAGGGMGFGADGYLYVTGGDGAAWHFNDYGQDGNPVNPCGDPPGGAGTALTPPTAEGGRLRSQDMRTTGDPAGLNGSLIRIDPNTGLGVSGNPFFSSSDAMARRIIGYGFRNPFRLTIRPGTSEAWVGDVGHARAANFGWPCYEGANRFGSFDSLNLNICENLYATSGAVTPPYWAYDHNAAVVSGENCPNSGNALAGLAFYPTAGGSFPAAYAGALFFADNSRNCIWALLRGTNGLPDPNQRVILAEDANYPVDLKVGPGGHLYYVDIGTGAIRRINSTTPANAAPNATAAADPTYGALPLEVNFDATGSTDPNSGDALTYEWDFDGDGDTDSTSATPTHTYNTAGNFTAELTVRDQGGLADTDTVVIRAGNTPPTAIIDTPTAGTRWKVGDPIAFSGHATDAQQGTLDGTALTWSLVMRHCVTPTSCHSHQIQDYAGVGGGSFNAPDHEYPSYLELTVTATDAGGLTDTETMQLDPQTVRLTLASEPAGAAMTFNSETATAPLTHEVIARSRNSIGVTTPQTITGQDHVFESWSDGGAASHDVTAPDSDATLTANLTPVSTATFSPEADARVQEANPSSNYGLGFLRTNGASNPDIESYLRFQLSGIAGQVSSAKLRLYATNNATVDGPAAYGASSSWTETGINWANRPARTSGPLDDKGPIGTGMYVEWDVTPLVTGNGTISIALATTSGDGVDFASREDGTASRRPQLVVTYTPQEDLAPPTPPVLTAEAAGATEVDLSWSGAGDDIAVTGYEIYRGSVLIATVGAVTSFTDSGLEPGTAYTYTVRALDAAGKRSAPSNSAEATTPVPAPTATIALTAAADARVQEANATTNYATSYLRADGASNPDVDSYLRFDLAGISGHVTSAKLRLHATNNATSDGPAAYGTSTSWTETGINWSNRPVRTTGALDDRGAIAAGTAAEWDVTPLVAGNGAVGIVLGATSNDGANFASREDSTASRRPQLIVTYTPVPDSGPPAAPTGLTAQATGPTQASLSWTAATDDTGVTGYEVYRGGALVATLGNVTSYADTGLSPNTTYSYTVRALDAAGNRSAPSDPASAITPASPTVTTLTFAPVADARVNEGSATKNYATTFLRTVNGSNPQEDTYIRFQPAGITGAVTNARLRLHVDDGTPDGPAVYGTSSSWTETGINWSNRPARATGAVDDRGSLATGTTAEWNVTPLVTGDGAVSFALATPSSNGANFSSRENTTAARRPQLVVTFGG
jgi:PKD repeat protein